MSRVEIPRTNFADERGEIRDLLVSPVDSITRISTAKGAVRGNHYHEHTVQWTYVLSGALLMANDRDLFKLSAGEMVRHDPGQPHAWRAYTETDCLVFTRGPRSGDAFEEDTIRLEEPLLLP